LNFFYIVFKHIIAVNSGSHALSQASDLVAGIKARSVLAAWHQQMAWERPFGRPTLLKKTQNHNSRDHFFGDTLW
jgi:hypothetical protein